MLRTATYPAALAGFLSVCTLIQSPALAGDGERVFSIAPGDVPRAIADWKAQTRLQVLYDYKTVARFHTQGISGPYRPLDALGALLRGTVLTYGVVNNTTVAVIVGSQYCEPWLGRNAPLPPCEQMPKELQGATL